MVFTEKTVRPVKGLKQGAKMVNTGYYSGQLKKPSKKSVKGREKK
jgi:nitrogen fixation/metabolism regulation signal transduction histidine kinase